MDSSEERTQKFLESKEATEINTKSYNSRSDEGAIGEGGDEYLVGYFSGY